MTDTTCSGNYLDSSHAYRDGFFCTLCGKDAPADMDRPHRPCVCPDCSSSEPSAGEQALDDIAAICECPDWEYPGQVIRDVKGLLVRMRAMERILLERRKALNDRSRPEFNQAELVAIDTALKDGMYGVKFR